jgi:hypothetical protein
MGSILKANGDENVEYKSLTPNALIEYDSPIFNKRGSVSNNQADHSTGKVID